MSILIEGMEMPKSCGFCPLRHEARDGDECYLGASLTEYQKRPDDCPLVSVPPHGDLCDKNALINKIGEHIDKAKNQNYDWWYACTVAYDFALAAPTIIPASEEDET